MKLLLQTSIPDLGTVGDVVDVSDGYGRNYLLPQRLAVANTPENRRSLETQKLIALQREEQRQELAQVSAKDLKNALLQVFMKAQEDGTLFGSVTRAIVAKVQDHAGGLAGDPHHRRDLRADAGVTGLIVLRTYLRQSFIRCARDLPLRRQGGLSNLCPKHVVFLDGSGERG